MKTRTPISLYTPVKKELTHLVIGSRGYNLRATNKLQCFDANNLIGVRPLAQVVLLICYGDELQRTGHHVVTAHVLNHEDITS